MWGNLELLVRKNLYTHSALLSDIWEVVVIILIVALVGIIFGIFWQPTATNRVNNYLNHLPDQSKRRRRKAQQFKRWADMAVYLFPLILIWEVKWKKFSEK